MRYYNTYTVEWSNLTFIFYFLIVLAGYFLPKIKRKITFKIFGKTYSDTIGLLLIELILIFVKGFCASGRDLVGGYYISFLSASSMEAFRDQSVEKGFILLNVIVKRLFHEYWIFILVIAVLTVMPVFRLIRKYADYIDVSLAVFLYVSIFYFSGFSLLRISLAATIGIYSFDAMYEKKAFKAFMWIIAAAFFHTSMLCLLIPYFLVFARQLDRKLIAIIIIGLLAILYFNQKTLSYLLTGRYAIYSISNEGLGMEQFIYFIPLFFILLWKRKIAPNYSDFFRLSFCFVISGFFMGMMQYILPAFGRAYVAFLPIIIIIAHCCKQISIVQKKNGQFLNVFVFCYGIMRFYLYISQYYNADDIMPYTTCFGWRL